MMDAIHGCWAAVPTPLDLNGQIDTGMLLSHCATMIEAHYDGVVLFGTTGEGTSFAASERIHAVEALLGGGISARQIALGVGAPATPDAIFMSRAALEHGLTHVLALPPYFYRDVSPLGIEDSFCRLIDGIGDDRLRLSLYHIPQTSGVAIPPEVAANLRARYGAVVAGLKDSSGNFADFEAFRAAAPDLAVTVGNEVDIFRAIQAGGAGTICGLGNIAPGIVRAMFDGPEALPVLHQVAALISGPFVPTLKAILAAKTGLDAWRNVRPPLSPINRDAGAHLAAKLAELRAF